MPELSWGTAAWFISSVNCFHFAIDAPSGKKKEMGEGRLQFTMLSVISAKAFHPGHLVSKEKILNQLKGRI